MTSIRVRLLVALMALVATAAAVLGVVTYRNMLLQAESLFDYQLRQMALSLRDQGEIDPSQAEALADDELHFVVQIWSVDGRSIYATRPHGDLPTRAFLGLADVPVGGEVWRTFSVATRERVIQVAQPRRIRKRLAADAAWRSVLPLLFLAPVLAGIGAWVVARSLAPLARVAADVRQRDEHGLQPLNTRDLPHEVEPLVAALNALLARLGESFDGQRAFVADAAHELRSPLTALKLQLRLLQRAPDEASRSAAIAALGAGIERSSRMVEQLLTLARSEPGAAASGVAPTAMDLGEVVREALVDTVPYAVSRGSEVELIAEGPVPFSGDRAALVILARNLVDNALRYSPPGAHVAVQVSATADGAVLQVDDNGPGIPPEDRERVFDRFYRRASHEEDGSGLGLAIVERIARRHRAQVSLGDSTLGGLRVTVRFAATDSGGVNASAPATAEGAGPHAAGEGRDERPGSVRGGGVAQGADERPPHTPPDGDGAEGVAASPRPGAR